MRLIHKRLLAASVAVLLGVAACGGDDNGNDGDAASNGSSTSGSSETKSFKIGVLTDTSGVQGPANKNTVDGAKAAAHVLKEEGIELEIVVADTTTTPQGATAAGQKLVQRDKVDAVIAVSAMTFAAAPAFAQAGIPVVGFPQDSPVWLQLKNMFSTVGPLDGTKVTSTAGEFFKLVGATKIGSLGFGISPQSALSAKAAKPSAEAAGLEAPYINANLAFGGNVQPIALAMKQAGVDGVAPSTDQNTALALITALKQLDAAPKAVTFATGYGAPTLEAGPNAVKTAEGAYFGLSYEPLELESEATKTFADALAATGGPDKPGLAAYNGYAAGLLLGEALKEVEADATSADILEALNGITEFDADGLRGDHAVNPGDRSMDPGDEQCLWYTQLKAGEFVPVENASPICGKVLDATVK